MNHAIRAKIKPFPHDTRIADIVASIRICKPMIADIKLCPNSAIRTTNITPKKWHLFDYPVNRYKATPYDGILPSECGLRPNDVLFW